MPTIKVIKNNKTYHITTDNKTFVSDALIDAGINIDRPCAGNGICGKCMVQFTDNPPVPNEYDKRLLDEIQIADGYRLSCKATINNDCTIQMADKSKNHNIITSGTENDYEVDLDNINEPNNYGIAVDIGTTTIVLYLVNLLNGEILSAKSCLNPQKSYGDNVITRCEYIHNNEDGLAVLQNAVLTAINKLNAQACSEASIYPTNIIRAVLSGNTIMQHILLGIDPYNISVAPFTPEFIKQQHITPADLDISISESSNIYITNSIAGYVGGDIVAGVVSCDMMESENINLLIDIGTNGEIVLGSKNKMTSCSVAAGPAFEGAHIKHGIGGVDGAINKTYIENDKIKFSTINNSTAIGIAGSGLLDIVSSLKELNIMDETGALSESHLTQIDDELVYPITENIYLTQKDIREVQLAKAAIAAGIDTLIQNMEIGYDDISNVYISGGFGSYMNVHSGANIGLLPKELERKCISIGNSSGTGSIKMLLSQTALSSAKKITDHVHYIELSMDMTFNNLFIENMTF